MKTAAPVLSDKLFGELSKLIYDLCGISLHDGKKELVQGRLSKRMRALGIGSFPEYLDHVRADKAGTEVTEMLDAISTNKTSFFREEDHFTFLAETLLPRLKDRGTKRVCVWSAGCSSGEEPYTIAITLQEAIPQLATWNARILATDISTHVLQKARQAHYSATSVEPVSPATRSRSFDTVGSHQNKIYQVKPHLRKLVHFARLNLMESWPMKGPFDAIFCRNVMIYFDRATRERLIGRYWSLLGSGGMFFVGHSESLTGIEHQFRYVQPAVYEKP
jgi:chemotaxis protein methyltransferase CheR